MSKKPKKKVKCKKMKAGGLFAASDIIWTTDNLLATATKLPVRTLLIQSHGNNILHALPEE